MNVPYRGSALRRLSFALGALLLPLLVFLVVMQVHWLGELADAQRTETRRMLTGAVERLAGDLQATLAGIERSVVGAEGEIAPDALPLVAEITRLRAGEKGSATVPSFVVTSKSGARFDVRLDVDRVASELCPALIRRALGDDALSLYRVAILALDADGSRAERPPLYRSDPSPATVTGPPDAAFDLQLVPNQWFHLLGATWTESPTPVFIAAAEDGGLEPGGSRAAPWRIEVRHRDGSIEKAFENARVRNLAIGGGLLSLLLAGLATLWIAEQRARRLLERELAFVAGISHELRTPLAVVRTAASNLEHGTITAPERVREYGALLTREADRLTTQVERVLRFGADEEEAAPRENVAVRAWIDAAVDRCEPWRDRQPFDIEVRIDADAPALEAEREALIAALHNLLENAIKYGDPRTSIRIDVAVTNELRLSVTNWGEPLTAHDRDHLFEPFYRGRSARMGGRPGSGLGLAVARGIVERHGGRLELLAANGDPRAVCFELRLPLPAEARP